jgi:glycosyltransferase involved in cell wall biosynthesis
MGWIVSQYGARQHYATARAFQRQGTLDVFYTEAWARSFRPLLRSFPGRPKAFANRWCEGLPDEKVTSFNLQTLLYLAARQFRRAAPTVESAHLDYIAEGIRFCRWVNRDLFKRQLSPRSDLFYGCKSVCLETLLELKKRAIFTLVDQADPGAVEERLVQCEREKWPGWEAIPGKVPSEYYDRCHQEWDTASIVMVYSRWTRQAIIDQGVAPEKVVVVPLAYEPQQPVARRVRPANQPLIVLWLGTVMLRKGIPYLLEAARLLIDRNIQFIVAGQMLVSQKALEFAPPNVQFVGRVIRDQTEAVYQSADIFVLPTISDSFALTQVEAMAHGLPVIATERCGEVVSNGVDGFIVPVGDSNALAKAIATLDDDRSLLHTMSVNAIQKSKAFSIASYAAQVREVVIQHTPELSSAI